MPARHLGPPGADIAGQAVATVAVDARILGDLRWNTPRTHPLAPALVERAVFITRASEPGRWNAVLTVNAAQLAAVEERLVTLRQYFVDVGFTEARVRLGFDDRCLKTARENVQDARQELAVEPAAA